MTVNAARRSRRRAAAPPPGPVRPAPLETMAIGEIGQTVFDCPKCFRPLAMGSRRCPGCRTRLIIGIPLAKASVFTSLGLAIGLAVGSVGGLVFAATRLPANAPGDGTLLPSGAAVGAIESGPATTPSPAVTSAPSPSDVGPSGDMPAVVRSALTQAVTLNERLGDAAHGLQTAATTTPFDASEVAQILRDISADSVYGEDLADRVAGWPDAGSAGLELRALYASIHESASAALVASVRNAAAYREGARAMLALLAGIPSVDAQVRDLATSYGVDLPEPSANP